MSKELILVVNDEIRLLTRDYKYAEDIVYLINKNKSFLKKTLGWIPKGEYTIEDAKNYIKNTTFDEKFDFVKDFVIEYRGEIVGVIDLHEPENNEINIGYWLDEDKQGNGIITKSCKTLLKYAFENLPYDKINIFCNVKNVKSENVAKRLGMKFECIVENRENLSGVWVDHKKYSVVKSEFVIY